MMVQRFALLVMLLTACSDPDEGGVKGDAGDASDGTALFETSDATDATPDGLDAAIETVADVDVVDITDTTPTETAQDATEVEISADTVITQVCTPGASICNNLDSRRICEPDGEGYGEPMLCDSDETCRAGTCQVRCPNDPKFGSYVGCEFWATDLPNYPDPALNPTPENLPWALVVSNPGAVAVRVGFEMPPLFSFSPADDAVPPGESRVFQLPNINVQGTSLMPKGVHLTASGPVLVHQFNPWDNRFSNDASLLIPDPLLGTDYVILSWPTSPLDAIQIPGLPTPPNQNGYFTVIAAYDDTDVTFTVTAPVRASGAIPALAVGETHTVRLGRGDVLSIQTDPDNLFGALDITGSRVTANKPISVFGGHEEAVVGDPIEVQGENGPTTQSPCCADHLEEQMLPVPMLGDHYFAVKAPPRGLSQIEDDFWRIQAAEDGVTITTVPATNANGVTLANKGDFVEVKSQGTFEVTGTGRLQIGQYLSSRDTTEDFTGDASLVLMVPEARYRKDYAFSTPSGYTKLWVSLVKQAGTTITIDGAVVPEANFQPIGASGWSYGYYAVAAGYHVASAPNRFGLFVYGYNNAVSFSYIGGIAGPGE